MSRSVLGSTQYHTDYDNCKYSNLQVAPKMTRSGRGVINCAKPLSSFTAEMQLGSTQAYKTAFATGSECTKAMTAGATFTPIASTVTSYAASSAPRSVTTTLSTSGNQPSCFVLYPDTAGSDAVGIVQTGSFSQAPATASGAASAISAAALAVMAMVIAAVARPSP